VAIIFSDIVTLKMTSHLKSAVLSWWNWPFDHISSISGSITWGISL